MRAARASAALDGATLTRDGRVRSPIRCWPGRCGRPSDGPAARRPGAPRRCRRWPGCTCWPRRTWCRRTGTTSSAGHGRCAAAERLALLADLVTGGSAAPAPVLVAVVHGELLALEPFASANGVVARAAARLAAIGVRAGPAGLGRAGGRAPAGRRGVPGGGARASRRARPTGWPRGSGIAATSGRQAPAKAGRSPTPGAGTKMTGGGPPRGSPPADATLEIQACTTCRDGGLGVQRPGTQAHDDMPPAACCAWSARSSRTEP